MDVDWDLDLLDDHPLSDDGGYTLQWSNSTVFAYTVLCKGIFSDCLDFQTLDCAYHWSWKLFLWVIDALYNLGGRLLM